MTNIQPAKTTRGDETMKRGRLYMYYADHDLGNIPEPMFIPEDSTGFNHPEHSHLPIVTEEEFLAKKEEYDNLRKKEERFAFLQKKCNGRNERTKEEENEYFALLSERHDLKRYLKQ